MDGVRDHGQDYPGKVFYQTPASKNMERRKHTLPKALTLTFKTQIGEVLLKSIKRVTSALPTSSQQTTDRKKKQEFMEDGVTPGSRQSNSNMDIGGVHSSPLLDLQALGLGPEKQGQRYA